jgi:chromate transport protein ChrA
MKTLYAIIISLIITSTQALASNGVEDGISFITAFFIGFGVLIILFQFIPGMLLFWCMIKGLISSSIKEKQHNKGEIK